MFNTVRIRSLAFALVLGAVGCSNMLGLDGLKFEDRAIPGASGGHANEAGTGGAKGYDIPGPTTSEPRDDDLPWSPIEGFPMQWPTGTLVAWEPESGEAPYYFAYTPSAHRLTSHQLRTGEDRIGQHSWAPDIEWTHLVVLPDELNGPVVIGYDSRTGILERASKFRADGSFETKRQSGNIHTHLLLVPLGHARLIFGYDSNSGFYRAVPATPDDKTKVRSGVIGAGWFEVVSFYYQEEATVALYDVETGEFEFYQFPEDTDTMVLVKQGSLAADASLVNMPSAYPDQLGLYYSNSGALHLWDLSDIGAGGASGSAVVEPTDLRRGLSAITAFSLAGELAISSFDGQVLDLSFPFAIGGRDEPIIR